MTTNTCQGKMAELMALMKENGIRKNFNGLNTFIALGIEGHLMPALEDTDNGQWNSEDAEAWVNIFENDIVLAKANLLDELQRIADPILFEESYVDMEAGLFWVIKSSVDALNQIATFENHLVVSMGRALTRVAKIQEGGAE